MSADPCCFVQLQMIARKMQCSRCPGQNPRCCVERMRKYVLKKRHCMSCRKMKCVVEIDLTKTIDADEKKMDEQQDSSSAATTTTAIELPWLKMIEAGEEKSSAATTAAIELPGLKMIEAGEEKSSSSAAIELPGLKMIEAGEEKSREDDSSQP